MRSRSTRKQQRPFIHMKIVMWEIRFLFLFFEDHQQQEIHGEETVLIRLNARCGFRVLRDPSAYSVITLLMV